MDDSLNGRLARVRERIAAAAEHSGRTPDSITLVAVSKTVDVALIQQAVDLGVRHLGENRVQEAADKIPVISGQDLTWHLIGHLQSNKVKAAVEVFNCIQSLDSVKLAERLERIAADAGKRVSVLLQVDLGLEPTKSGATESEVAELVKFVDAAPHLDLRGLMTVPPFAENPEEVRPYFRSLRGLLESLNLARDRPLTELSMGMSHDFEVAIEEGATIVRVGTSIFGSRSAA